MAQLITELHADAIAERLGRAHERIAQAARTAGRDPGEVELLIAAKYVPVDQLPQLARAGVRLLGENRAQDLQEKVAAHGQSFTWDFIGQLQSRKVRAIVPHVRLIHSVASASAMRELARRRELARPGLELLIEVDLAGEEGKAGVRPAEIDGLIEIAPFPVTGLMTMPPATEDPQRSRRWFDALRELAQQRGLRRLSMGTSQDYAVAVEEGATIVRLGRSVLA